MSNVANNPVIWFFQSKIVISVHMTSLPILAVDDSVCFYDIFDKTHLATKVVALPDLLNEEIEGWQVFVLQNVMESDDNSASQSKINFAPLVPLNFLVDPFILWR